MLLELPGQYRTGNKRALGYAGHVILGDHTEGLAHVLRVSKSTLV